MKKNAFVAVMILVLLIVSACGNTKDNNTTAGSSTPQGSPQSSPQAGKKLKIGYAINTLNNPFFVAVKEGAEKEAAKQGVDIAIVNANDDLSVQLSGVEDLIQQKIDVLILDPVDSQGTVPAVEAANKAGIKVITTGRQVDGGSIVTHLGYNEIKHGVTAGEFLAKQLNGKGNVVELQGIMGTNVAQDRSKGFNEGVAKSPDVKVIATQSADFDRAKALTVMENILQAQPKIDGVYAANDEMALGALQAIQAANRTGITIVSNDGTMDALQAIKAGDIAGTMGIYPNQYGQKAIQIALDVVKGQSVETTIELPSIFVSKDNVEDAIKESQN
ncbi:substrate-binding domain-containing protein [Paenibacillus eucommiae]|uniref:Ribose transport system substrate-binding protein n=1 Tax=Paenibacillus eucommiae TaxID=1355755 RepID=A0ABS4IYS5_9BACL|nr:substrate-binding domain-containing protein [Paenibacillus eucommiae]MBP1992131.1 ribose transport system substrate-binding protein [Paenibacillus eucommiae]